jgi:hypothetical protein
MKQRLLAWISGRERRKGLRPRDAAILIVIVWVLAMVIFDGSVSPTRRARIASSSASSNSAWS